MCQHCNKQSNTSWRVAHIAQTIHAALQTSTAFIGSESEYVHCDVLVAPASTTSTNTISTSCSATTSSSEQLSCAAVTNSSSSSLPPPSTSTAQCSSKQHSSVVRCALEQHACCRGCYDRVDPLPYAQRSVYFVPVVCCNDEF
eukprot:3711-Heterococcus_DN1.PRE.5